MMGGMNGDEIISKGATGIVALTVLLVIIRATGIVGWPWIWSFAPALALIGLAVFGSGLALLWVIAGILLRGGSGR